MVDNQETEGSSRSREGKEKKDLSRERGEKKEQSPGRDDRKDRHKPRDDGKSRRERSRDGRDKENREHSKDRTKEEEKRRHHRDKGNDSAVENEPKVNGKAANIAPASIVIEEGASVAGVDEQPAKIPRPTSAKGSRRRTREDEDERFRSEVQVPPRDDPETNRQIGEEDLPPQVVASRKMARPPSARPAPPKLKKQNEPISQDPDVRISSGKRVTNVIVDSTRSDEEADDDDDNFIVQDGGTSLEPEPEPLAMRQDEDEVDSGEHGGLVKKILVTKKELEEGSQQSGTKKTGVEKPLVSDAARRKEREMVQREIDKLRVSIQTLTRSANPLGKIMDYVQEDLDSMQKELQKWKMENKDHLLALKQEQSITDNSVEPLKAQLKDLDQTISDQFIQIAAVKAKILRNDEKINKMLGSITKS
ncbi:TRAF3-interacting protein 1-like [Tubulanus polymorphus]|uniref:TRAF3-interacting protein 1-like n=1 Tax=Tubulanus polymorphus TaxID=672921 RepID=UPI003DA2FB79